MKNQSDDEDDDIEALRLAALESLKRKNQANAQLQLPVENVPIYQDNVIPNHIQPVYPPFQENEMGFPNHPPPEEPMLYPPNSVGYPPPDGLNQIPLHPVDNCPIDFNFPPPPVEIVPGFHPDGPPMMGPPPNAPFAPPPPGPDMNQGMFFPPPPGPGPMMRPMFNEMGAPMHPRQQFRRQRGKRGKMGFQFRGAMHMRLRAPPPISPHGRPPPPHVRLPPPNQAPHHNLITLTESQAVKKSEETNEKTEETPKENTGSKAGANKDKIYNSLDLPQHRYCKVTANTKAPEEDKNEESSKFSRYEKEDSDSSESSEDEEKEEKEEEEEEDDPDVLNLLDDDEDDLDKLMEKMEKEMSGDSKNNKSKSSKSQTKKTKNSSLIIYDTNNDESSEVADTDVKESKPIRSNEEIRIVKYCDNPQESAKELEHFENSTKISVSDADSKTNNSEANSNLGVNSTFIVNDSSSSNLETRNITKVDSDGIVKTSSSRSRSKSPSSKKLSPGHSKTSLLPPRSEFSPPPRDGSPNRATVLESTSPRLVRQYSPRRYRSKSRSPYFSKKSPVYSRKSPGFSPPSRQFSRSPSPRRFSPRGYSDHRRRSPPSPSYRAGSPVRSPGHRYPRYSSPGRSPGRRLISPTRARRSLSISPPRYRSPGSPGRRPLSPARRYSPNRRPLSPGRRPLSPNRRFPSPSRRPLSPIRRPLSPVRRPVSPGRRPLSPPRRIGPSRRPLSPERRPRRHPDSPPRRALSPGARSPIRRFSPGRRSLSPGRRSLSPLRRPLSPARRPMSPIRRPLSPVRRLSPLRRPGSPSRRPLSPLRRPGSPLRRPLSPGRRPLSPNRRPLSPIRKPNSPVKRSLSPVRRHASPQRPFSPTKRQLSPERRHHPSRRPFSPPRRALSPSRRLLSPPRRQLSPARNLVSPIRRPLSPSRRPRSPVRPKSPIAGLSPGRRPVSPARSPRDHGTFSPSRRPTSPRSPLHYRRNSPRRSPNYRHNLRKSASPGFSTNKATSSSQQRSRSPRWKKSELDKRSTSPKERRHRSPHGRKLDSKASVSGNQSNPPSSNNNTSENANAKRKFDARDKILDKRKQNENKSSKRSNADNDAKEKLAPAEQLDPVLEARRRKFESTDVVKPMPKKIKLSNQTASQGSASGNADNSRKPLTAQNPHRVQSTAFPEEREFIPDFSEPLPGLNVVLAHDYPVRSRLPSWAEPEEPTVCIKQEMDADVPPVICDFGIPNAEERGVLRPAQADATGEAEEPSLVINFDPMELNETGPLNATAQKPFIDDDLIPQQPDKPSDATLKPLIKLKPLTDLLDRNVLKKKIKKEGEEKVSKKKKKNKKHKVKDRDSDEEMDLRNELKRRRAERMNQVGAVNESLPSRLVQSAFEGVMGKRKSKTKEEKHKKHKRIKEEKPSKDRRRVLVISSSAKHHSRSSLSPVSDANEDDELGDEMMYRRAEEPEDELAMRRKVVAAAAASTGRPRRTVSRKQV